MRADYCARSTFIAEAASASSSDPTAIDFRRSMMAAPSVARAVVAGKVLMRLLATRMPDRL